MKGHAFLVCALITVVFATGCKKDKEDKPADTTAEKPAEPMADTPAETPPPTEPATPPVPERPASVTDGQVKVADDLVAAFQSAATAAEEAKGDCKVMAKGLKASAAQMQATVKVMEKMKDKVEHTPEGKAWAEAVYEPKMTELAGKLMAAAAVCEKDPAVMAALKSLGSNPDAKSEEPAKEAAPK